MRRLRLCLLAGLALCASPLAHAQDFCSDTLAALDDASTGFAAFRGEPLNGLSPAPGLVLFESSHLIGNASECVVAEVELDSRLASTSFTCTGVAPDSDAAVNDVLARLQACLGVSQWAQYAGQGAATSTLSASYGQFLVSLTRNGDLGVALGIEAFRDERGAVKGSPVRGDATGPDGRQRCSPRNRAEIEGFLLKYAQRPGAKRFENDKFIGYTNSVSSPTVAFMTKPNHPAHPAIIVRDVNENGGSTSLSASGDFAGDCEAFHVLLQEVIDMNRNVSRQ